MIYCFRWDLISPIIVPPDKRVNRNPIIVRVVSVAAIDTPVPAVSDLVIKEGLALVERVKDTPPAIEALEIPLAGFEFVTAKLFAVPVFSS